MFKINNNKIRKTSIDGVFNFHQVVNKDNRAI